MRAVVLAAGDLASSSVADPSMSASPGLAMFLLFACSLACLGLARLSDRQGLGSGFLTVVLADELYTSGHWAHGLATRASNGELQPGGAAPVAG